MLSTKVIEEELASIRQQAVQLNQQALMANGMVQALEQMLVMSQKDDAENATIAGPQLAKVDDAGNSD